MKKVKYPNLDDYDLSDYVELKGDILYKINGGTTMSSADQQAMAEACKNGNTEKQAEIKAKYETKDSTSTSTSTGTNGLSKPTSTATSTTPTQVDTPAQSTALDHGQQAEMAKQDAERKTGGAGSSSNSGGNSSYDSGSGYSGGSASNSSKSSESQSSTLSISHGQQYEMALKTAAEKKSTSETISNSSANNCQRITPKATNKYAVDYENKIVKVDIKDRESYENALKSYITNSIENRFFKFQLTDGENIVHTFSRRESAVKLVSKNGILSDLNANEKNVEAFVRNIEQNPDNYYMEAYQRKALCNYFWKRDEVLTHSLYVITDKSTGEKSTLSFNGSIPLCPVSKGAWGLNTKTDVKGWNCLVSGKKDYDMTLYCGKDEIDVQKTSSNIIQSINSDISYMFIDHKWDWKNWENCNTALYSTEVIKR